MDTEHKFVEIDYEALERRAMAVEEGTRAHKVAEEALQRRRQVMPLAGAAAAALSALAAAQSGSPELGRRMRAAVKPIKDYQRPTKGKPGGKRRRKNRK